MPYANEVGNQFAGLEIRMLGAPQILINGRAPQGLRARKAIALLCYLAAELRTCSREEIAELLWGEGALDAGKSLRVDLTKLNKHMGRWLEIRPNSLALRAGDDVRIDVHDYLQAFTETQHNPDALGVAVAGYHGDFLAGFSPPNPTPELEEWIEIWRARLRARHCDLLARAAQHHMAHQRWQPALACAQTLHAITPLDLAVNRLTLTLYGLTSQLSMARSHLARTERLACEDPGALDLAELHRLLAQIESGESPLAVGAAQIAPQIAPQWGAFQAAPIARHFCPRPSLIAEIIQELRDSSSCAILALVGTAGVGKTTLANALAHQLAPRFPDGVLWGNAAITPPSALIDGWAQTLGFDFSRLPDLESKAAAWRSAVARRRILVIIDDVVDPTGLGALFPATAGACVLLTTRDREAALALNAHEVAIGAMDAPTCRMLLEKILGSARVAAEADAADHLCEVVQGLPLALEILAKRLLYAPFDRIADLKDRLVSTRRRLDLLRHGSQSVRASLSLTWELLDGALRRACAVAGTFEGHPFTAEALTYLLHEDRYTVGDLIVGMLQRSLATAVEDGRFQQHTLIAEFANEQIEDRATIEERMADYYCSLAHFRRSEISRLESEWPLLRRTLHRLAASRQDLRLLTMVEDLTPTWFGKGNYTEAREGLGLAVPAARKLDDHTQYVRIMNDLARACIEQADFDEALEHLDETQAIADQTNEMTFRADALILRGRVEIERAEFDAAQAHFAEARRIKESLGEEDSVALALYFEADIPYYARDYARAQEMAMQALAAFGRAQNPIGRVQCLGLLADIAIARDSLSAAEEYCLSALEICDKREERCERAVIHYSLSNVYLKLAPPNLRKALDHINAGIVLLQRMGDRTTLARALLRKSAIELRSNETANAHTSILTAINLDRELDNRWSLVYDLRQLGAVATAARDYSAAASHQREAIAIADGFASHPLRTKLESELDDICRNIASA